MVYIIYDLIELNSKYLDVRKFAYATFVVATTLTPWELWLVRKTEDERKRIEQERQEKVAACCDLTSM